MGSELGLSVYLFPLLLSLCAGPDFHPFLLLLRSSLFFFLFSMTILGMYPLCCCFLLSRAVEYMSTLLLPHTLFHALSFSCCFMSLCCSCSMLPLGMSPHEVRGLATLPARILWHLSFFWGNFFKPSSRPCNGGLSHTFSHPNHGGPHGVDFLSLPVYPHLWWMCSGCWNWSATPWRPLDAKPWAS